MAPEDASERYLREAIEDGVAPIVNLNGDVLPGSSLADAIRTSDQRLVRLTIIGATVTGRMDFGDSHCGLALEFRDTTFEEEPSFVNAHVFSISFKSCAVPGLDLQQTIVDRGLNIADCQLQGILRCNRAQLERGMTIVRTVIAGGHTAIMGEWLHSGASITLENIRADGSVWLLGATVRGDLRVVGSSLDGSRGYGGYALNGKLASIDGMLRFDSKAIGELRLGHIAINGDLDLRGAHLTTDRRRRGSGADCRR